MTPADSSSRARSVQATASAAPGPETFALSRELVARVGGALARLDPPTRETGLLRLAGYSREEIGRRLGSGPATTKDRAARALRVARSAALA